MIKFKFLKSFLVQHFSGINVTFVMTILLGFLSKFLVLSFPIYPISLFFVYNFGVRIISKVFIFGFLICLALLFFVTSFTGFIYLAGLLVSSFYFIFFLISKNCLSNLLMPLRFLGLFFTVSYLFNLSSYFMSHPEMDLFVLENWLGMILRRGAFDRVTFAYLFFPSKNTNLSSYVLTLSVMVFIIYTLVTLRVGGVRDRIVLSLYSITLFFASARSPLIFIVFILFQEKVSNAFFRRLLVLGGGILVFASYVVGNAASSGRRDLLVNILPHVGFVGKGLGFSREFIKFLTFDRLDHVHHVWVELIVDFGVVGLIILFVVYFYSFRHSVVATSFFLFCICSLGFSVYSPWFWLILSICLKFDLGERKVAESIEGWLGLLYDSCVKFKVWFIELREKRFL